MYWSHDSTSFPVSIEDHETVHPLRTGDRLRRARVDDLVDDISVGCLLALDVLVKGVRRTAMHGVGPGANGKAAAQPGGLGAVALQYSLVRRHHPRLENEHPIRRFGKDGVGAAPSQALVSRWLRPIRNDSYRPRDIFPAFSSDDHTLLRSGKYSRPVMATATIHGRSAMGSSNRRLIVTAGYS